MTSEPTEAYVWVWLPGNTTPVVAGILDLVGPVITFTYARSYRARPNAISLYFPELPLADPDAIAPRVGEVANCIEDAAPDSWGRRVVLARRRGDGRPDVDPGLLAFLLESGSDRIGALDFQSSPAEFEPRGAGHPGLTELAEATARLDEGRPLTPELELALIHGTSVGGARPKALLDDDERLLIAKFSSSTDTQPVVKWEFVAMELGRRAGLNVAPVEITTSLGRDVLLVERFDRPGDGTRRLMVSALTILGLTPGEAMFAASYADLAGEIRQRFTEPDATLRELFERITFNILVSNTDDHARNHGAFWDGKQLTLTPGYDICPQPRSGGETRQLMAIGDDGYRMSQLIGCLERSGIYHLTKSEARGIVDRQIEIIRNSWDEVCDQGRLAQREREALWGRQFLNPYALYDYASASGSETPKS
ncbi:MAG: type II toxin-antitoxin system HipA family toxin [Acidimicrobiales bacterium]